MRNLAAIVALMVVSLAAVAAEHRAFTDVGAHAWLDGFASPAARCRCRMPPGPPGVCTPG